jgi:serine/threonine protein kinase
LDARIADLGLATLVRDGEDGTKVQTQCGGTQGYRAPEVGTKKFSNKVDIYSCAVMFFEMAVGEMPDISTDATFEPLNHDPATSELLKLMLKVRSADRSTATQLISHIKVLLSRPVLQPIIPTHGSACTVQCD